MDPEDFFKNSSAEQLLKYVDKSVKCEICDKTYASKNNLSLHIKSVHHNIKGNKCKFCEKAYSRNYDLKIHMKYVHNEQMKKNEGKKDEDILEKTHQMKNFSKFFECEICARKFDDPIVLRFHKKTVHEGQKPQKQIIYVRDHKFGNIKVLEKCNFNCEFCGKSFTNSTTKATHIDKVHGRNFD